MYEPFYSEFLISDDTLRVYEEDNLLFSSDRDGLLPLLQYIESFGPHNRKVVIFDKVTGNAAALLSVLAGCIETFSPLGSRITIDTLEKYGIKYHIAEIVPYI